MVDPRHVPRRVARFALFLAAFLLATLPYWSRLGWASLYMDDVVRVSFRQTETLGQSLFRPFNEHLAPLFEVVTWLTWSLAGRQLGHAPLAFTLSSYLPFLLSLVLLYRLAKDELRDEVTALAAPLVFALSSLANETVFWYSASSFTWALALILGAWIASVRSSRSVSGASRLLWLALAALASLAAPCFCGLGLLAGPIAVVRFLLGSQPIPTNVCSGLSRGANLLKRSCWVGIPALGTFAYLLLAFSRRHSDVLAASAERNLNLAQGISCILRAPVDVLVPGLVGLPNLDRWLPLPVEACLFLVGLMGVGVWAARSAPARPAILTGLTLILGGYGLTYPLRASADPAWVITVQRYHLLPQAGLAVIVASAILPVIACLRRSAEWLPGFATLGLALTLVLIQSPGIKRHARFFRYPEQIRTLVALDRLTELAQERGVSRDQVLHAFDPIRNAWSPDPRLFNALEMLPVWSTGLPSTGVDRASLLQGLDVADREALCGGMDVSRYLVDAGVSDRELLEPGEIVARSRSRILDGPGRFESEGELAFVEFAWSPGAPVPTALLLTDPAEGEIWWTNARNEWSPLRSATWVLPKEHGTYRVSLDALPHWQWSGRRMRILIRKKDPVAFSAPRLLR